MGTDIQLNSSLFLYLGVFTFIVVSICAAAIKWLHVCKPYRDKVDEYFPNRKHWILIFCFSLFLLGTIVCPSDRDNIIILRCYAILAFPGFMISGIITQCCQRQKEKLKHLKKLNIAIDFAATLCIISWFTQDFLSNYKNAVIITTAIFGFLYTAGVIKTLMWLSKQIQHFYENKYSSEEYYPTSFAIQIRPMVGTIIPITWALLLTENVWVIGTSYFLLAVAELLFLIYVLDVHLEIQPAESTNSGKAQTLQDEMDETYQEEEIEEDNVSTQTLKDIENFMRSEQVYLDAKLTIMDLARQLNLNVPTLRATCKKNYGSFIKMVNKYRLEHAKNLMEKYPNYSKQAIAEESGFGSYRSLRRAEQLEEESDNS